MTMNGPLPDFGGLVCKRCSYSACEEQIQTFACAGATLGFHFGVIDLQPSESALDATHAPAPRSGL
jgi:hypothetical protein